MTIEQQFSMSRYATKKDRYNAINAAIDRLAEKRNYAADVSGNVMLAVTYQNDIDKLLEMLPPNN